MPWIPALMTPRSILMTTSSCHPPSPSLPTQPSTPCPTSLRPPQQRVVSFSWVRVVLDRVGPRKRTQMKLRRRTSKFTRNLCLSRSHWWNRWRTQFLRRVSQMDTTSTSQVPLEQLSNRERIKYTTKTGKTVLRAKITSIQMSRSPKKKTQLFCVVNH